MFFSSKVLFTWEFVLNGTAHKIELWDSKLSGKKKLAVNDEVIADYKDSIAVFNYSFDLDSHSFNLVQLSDGNYDIKIDGIFFNELKQAELSDRLKKPQKNDETINSNNDTILNNKVDISLDKSSQNDISFNEKESFVKGKKNLID